jgi:hypothetical protein
VISGITESVLVTQIEAVGKTFRREWTMKRDQVLERLTAGREDLARLGVRSLALFGSVAREEAGPSSDIDLLVEFEGTATLDRYLCLESYLEELLGCSVDLLTQRSLKPSLRSVIEKDVRYVPGLSPVSG